MFTNGQRRQTKGIYQWSVTILDLSNHPPKAQLRATLSPFQTSFNPYLYSSGSSSVGSALVESSNYKIFILNRGIVADIMSSTSSEPGCVQCIPLHQGCCQPVCRWAYRHVGISGASRNLERGVQPLAHENAPGRQNFGLPRPLLVTFMTHIIICRYWLVAS